MLWYLHKKSLTKHVTDRGLEPRVYKELLQPVITPDPVVWHSGKDETLETGTDWWTPGLGREEEVQYKEVRANFMGHGIALYVMYGGGQMTVKTYQTLY